MKALVFVIRLNSLYSIRIPFTWQSALTYPVLPPSAIIGMLANSIQRYKNDRHPLHYLELIEKELILARSRLIEPAVTKSYITSVITKWQDNYPGGKFTNALGREFAYSKMIQVLAVFNDESKIEDITESLHRAPLTCGDSESPVSIEGEILIKEISEVRENEVITEFPIPFHKEINIIEGDGRVYLMHERCLKNNDGFPLTSFMVPIREDNGLLRPSYLRLRVTNEKILEIKDTGKVIINKGF
ncbi:MAG: CRISPR-associated protein Cas5 [Candidatus Aminicenantes bacterium]|nr:CRISPR-associated protein Cas5 [Candidatus Aminicenantes bacterium]